MTTTCVLLAGLIHCTLAPGPRLTPADAAAILAPHQFPDTTAPFALDGPNGIVIESSSTAGPYGEFRPFSPMQRLDGSLVTEAPWGVYSASSWFAPVFHGRAPVIAAGSRNSGGRSGGGGSRGGGRRR